MYKLQIELLTPTAIAPRRATDGSIGYDISSDEEVVLRPFDIKAISTGIKVKTPHSVEFQIRSRSGLSLKGIVVLNAPGTIDSDYYGELKVIIMNLSSERYLISKGDRIAQGVLATKHTLDVELVDNVEIIRSTRAGGFGSTDISDGVNYFTLASQCKI